MCQLDKLGREGFLNTLYVHFLVHFFCWPGGIFPRAFSMESAACSNTHPTVQPSVWDALTKAKASTATSRAYSVRFCPRTSRHSRNSARLVMRRSYLQDQSRCAFGGPMLTQAPGAGRVSFFGPGVAQARSRAPRSAIARAQLGLGLTSGFFRRTIKLWNGADHQSRQLSGCPW